MEGGTCPKFTMLDPPLIRKLRREEVVINTDVTNAVGTSIVMNMQ